VAREFGVTREEVWQCVSIVRRLPAGAIKLVERAGDPIPDRRFSLRALLKVAAIPGTREKRAALRAMAS
jgi:hypothetical protein